MKAQDVRRSFLEFFVEREHREVASSPLILPKDPTLLFANAGMNQFKDTFTGKEARDYTRATTSQKCLRVSGKHNDLEMVGRTPRHHTFFEMLGNFSFGDYFKHEAIAFAWKLLTEVYGVPRERLWVTVFGGSDAVEADEEAYAIWRDQEGVPTERIMRLGEKENFWRMGDTGPCGPCSELHYDLGEDLTSVEGESNPETDERRYIEIWNLVFMQYEQHPDKLEKLPKPSIDTGMGLERITSVLQGKRSNYDTDVFMPILEAGARIAGVKLGENDEQDTSLRVIADHTRALCSLVSDGVVPSNDRRGYVLRRLLRRAIRHGRKLGIERPFLHEISPVVIDGLSVQFPELIGAKDAILEVGRREEERFAETLATGLEMLEKELEQTAGDGPSVLSGEFVFKLHDTFGFPLDLARDAAEDRGIELDESGFDAAMARQRSKAQASWKGAKLEKSAPIYGELAPSHQTRFEGYSAVELDGVPVGALIREGSSVDSLTEGQEGEVVLEATPFYAESGGQVGDRGMIHGPSGRLAVLDTQRPADGLIVHKVRVEQGELTPGQGVRAEVDAERRMAISRNHTATHLLHAALRECVGTHVKQAGSMVAPERLRFDFSHFAGLNERALEEIETLVNDQVLADTPIQTELMPIDEALSQGAMALFGEKYGDEVRVVRIGDFSLELCGGIHVGSTGEIGLCKVTGERGIASGTRRVEAISGDGSLSAFRELRQTVGRLEHLLSAQGSDLVAEVERRLEQSKALERELEKLKMGQVREQVGATVDDAPVVAGVKLFAQRVDGLEPKEMRELADSLRGKLGSGVVVLGRADGPKASLLVAVTEDLRKSLPAGDLVKSLAKIISGGGGGRPDMAEAGGKDPSKLDDALAAAKDEIARRMG